MNQIATELAEDTAPKTGIGILIGIEIFSTVLSIVSSCWKLHKDFSSSPAAASAFASAHYDEIFDTFDSEVLRPVRKYVRIAAKQQQQRLDDWQEILMAQSVLHKARSQAACSLCLTESN